MFPRMAIAFPANKSNAMKIQGLGFAHLAGKLQEVVTAGA